MFDDYFDFCPALSKIALDLEVDWVLPLQRFGSFPLTIQVTLQLICSFPLTIRVTLQLIGSFPLTIQVTLQLIGSFNLTIHAFVFTLIGRGSKAVNCDWLPTNYILWRHTLDLHCTNKHTHVVYFRHGWICFTITKSKNKMSVNWHSLNFCQSVNKWIHSAGCKEFSWCCLHWESL